jgi:hypothetical protein
MDANKLLNWMSEVCVYADSGKFTNDEIIEKIKEIDDFLNNAEKTKGDIYLYTHESYYNLRVKMGLAQSMEDMLKDLQLKK